MLSNLFAKLDDIKARRAEGEGGFTLIELLVVVVIIGVLIAIAIPLYLNLTDDAKNNSVQADIRAAVTQIQTCYGDNGSTLPADETWTASGAFKNTTKCSGLTISVSGDTTTSIAYKKVDASSYTVTATDKNTPAKTYVYDSKTTNIAAGA